MDGNVIVALVASASAVGGVLITQAAAFFREIFISKVDRWKFFREKYELLTTEMNESYYHRMHVSHYTGDNIIPEHLNKPLEKIYSMASLYFPELYIPTKDYYNAYRDYFIMLSSNYNEHLGSPAFDQAFKASRDECTIVVKQLDDAEDALRQAIRKNARKYARF